MTAVLAATFSNVASGLAFAVLLLPVAVVVRRLAAERPDPAQSVAVGVAFAAAVLVVAGLLLSLFDAVDATGWLAAILVVDAALLLGSRDRRELARRALPAGLALVALATAAGAIAFSHASAEDRDAEARFTQFWLIPRADGDVAEVGLRNREGRSVSYRVTVGGPSAGGAVLLERTIQVGSGRWWFGSLKLPATDRPERVTAELFRPGDAAPYRRVHVWTRVSP